MSTYEKIVYRQIRHEAAQTAAGIASIFGMILFMLALCVIC